MAKFFASDKHVKAIDIEGARTGAKTSYNVDKKGFYNVDRKDHIKAFRDSDMVEASLSGVTSTGIGFPCGSCGFGSFFVKCSRCGTENPRS